MPKKPFAGKRVPTSNTKAPRLKKAKKATADDSSGGDGGGRRSLAALLAAGAAGFAALWAWAVYSRAQQSTADRRILQAMASRPLHITEHAACRMDCRCVCEGGESGATAINASVLQPPSDAAPASGLRFVGRGEVTQALEHGRINRRKSAPALAPCPKYAVDAAVVVAAAAAGPRGGGGSGGKQQKQQWKKKHVQAVFAACPRETRLITVIDTDTDWACGPC